MHQGKEALAVYMKKVKSKYLDMATALLRRQRPSIRLPSFFLAMACKRASTASYSPTGARSRTTPQLESWISKPHSLGVPTAAQGAPWP